MKKIRTRAIDFLPHLTGKKHLELLILLGAYYAFQPEGYRHYKDSIEYFLTTAISESKALNEDRLGRIARCLLGKIYLQDAVLSGGDSVFDRLISDCQMAGDRETEARAFTYRGLYTVLSPASIKNKMIYLQKAGNIYHELNDRENQINIKTDLGYLSVAMFQLKNAQEYFMEALKLADSIGFPQTQYNTDALAMSLQFQNKFGESLRYTIETISIAENNRDSIGWAYFYHRLGDLYHSEGDREAESLKWLEKAMSRFILNKDAEGLYRMLPCIYDIFSVKAQSGQALDSLQSIYKKLPPKTPADYLYYHLEIASCYIGLRQFNLAEQHLLEAYQIEQEMERSIGPLRRALVTYHFGRLFFLEGQYAKSKSYFERYLADPSVGAVQLLGQIYAYNRLIDIDSVLGDPIAGVGTL